MLISKRIGATSMALAMLGTMLSVEAQAVPMVTYSWTTTSEGYGPHVSAPSSATFEVPLSDVIKGVITQLEISDIQLIYPGLTFNSAVVSSTGFDFSAFVDPATGAFIYKDSNQGLAVVAFAGTDINQATTLLSITVGDPNLTLNGVADQFNALNNGNAYAGYPTAGYWTATFPVPSTVPETSTWAMMLVGFAGIGLAGYRGSLKGRGARPADLNKHQITRVTSR
jgi:hypothetical protein